MPTRERVQALIDLVERGRFIEAWQSFYHRDASMQENLDPPRRGLDILIRGEERVMAAHREIRTRPVQTFLVEGDRAVINWIFDFVDHAGHAFTLDELAFQLWRADRIIAERFYYDPAQRGRRTAPG
jgi:ketosteroid isomerase-like protein